MATVSNFTFSDFDAFVVATDVAPDLLDFSHWNPSFDEFFFADTMVVLDGGGSSTNATGHVEFGGGGTAGTFTLTGSGFGTNSLVVKTLSYVDNDPAGTLFVQSTAGLAVNATNGNISGSINNIDYVAPGYHFHVTGAVPITTGVGTITSLHVDSNDGVNDVRIDVGGSFTVNFDTQTVTSGTVTSFGLFVNGEEIDASGFSVPATTFFGETTVQQIFTTAMAGADTITAGANDQTLSGFGGNDTYNFGNFTGVHADEGFNQGTDLVTTSHSYTLDPNVENATLLAGDGTTLIGNRFGNTLTGNANANTLDGGDGNDVLVGAAGNDTYIVDLQRIGTTVSLEDVVTEGLNAGTDTLVVRTPGSDDILKLIISGEDPVDLVRVADASNPIVGSWMATGAAAGQAGGTVVVTFFADGTYMMAQDGSSIADPTGQDGMESGTFTWNQNTHAFSSVTNTDTNGQWGFSDSTITAATVSGNTLTLTTDDGTFNATRVTSATSPIVGSWVLDDETSTTNIVFISPTQYMLIGDGTSPDLLQSITGMELGAYTWNPTNGQFTRGALLVNTDADAGLSDTPVVAATVNLGVPASSTFNVALPANVENLDLSQAGNTNLAGTGNAADNVLTGSGGNNLLDGALGNDTYVGSDGNDTYVIAQAGDIAQGEDAGSDTVKVALAGNTYLNLSDKTSLENVVFTGTGNAAITGNAADNTLTGGAGNDTIDGGAGNDAMAGGAGNDVYSVDSGGDVVNDSGGIDTIIANVDAYTIGTGVENLTLGANDSITSGSGNALANTLTGNGNENTLTGGAGNDTYVFQLHHGTVVEGSGAGSGIDLVKTAFDYTLDANVENATVLGSAGVSLTGNSLANLLTGSTGDDILTGGGGNDTLVGGAGNDTYHVNLVKPVTTVLLEDMVTDTGGTADWLTVHADGGLVLPAAGFTLMLAATLENVDISDVSQNINVTGNAANNIMLGGDGNNILDGGTGNDTYHGSAGNDTYLISQVGDVVSDDTDDGIDTVKVGATGNPAYLDISGKSQLENVIFTGTASVAISGNAADNSLTGGAGNDSINGGAGNDLMSGGGGNDVYTVDSAGDVVNDSAGTGDTVIANVNGYTIGAGVENLILGSDASITSGSGNALSNVLTSNANHPTLTGGAGNDTFIFQASLGTASELASGGTDLVKTAFNYTLDPFIENGTVLGEGGVSLTGNDLANLLTGSTGNDTLAGGAGNDTLVGGAGDDTYDVNLVKPATVVLLQDMVTDTAGTDTLRVHAAGDLTLPVAGFNLMLAATLENVDISDTGSLNINLTGNAANNYLGGNAGNNSLIGGAGNDTLDGYLGNDTFDGGTGNDQYLSDEGNDTYIISDAGDVIVPRFGTDDNGIDTVKVGATGNTDYLDVSDEGYLENVVFTGTLGVHITGNDQANSLTGAAGADSIDGGLGADTMIGLGGNDQYTVNDGGDVITDSAGIDTVLSSVNYTLGTGLENLTLTGSDPLSGTGNSLANKLIGNDGDNFLRGGGGLDTMTGGLGADTFVFSSAVATNANTITDFTHGVDHIGLDQGAVAGFANLFSTGSIIDGDFITGTTANAAHPELIYNTSTGALYYDADGTGGVAQVQIATIGTVVHPALAADDFTLISPG